MNQHEAQSKYKEFRDKLRALYCAGVAQHIERLALKRELEQFRQECLDNGITLLEPCPFCGSYDLVPLEEFENEVYVLCKSCEVEGPPCNNVDLAIAAWNTRSN